MSVPEEERGLEISFFEDENIDYDAGFLTALGNWLKNSPDAVSIFKESYSDYLNEQVLITKRSLELVCANERFQNVADLEYDLGNVNTKERPVKHLIAILSKKRIALLEKPDLINQLFFQLVLNSKIGSIKQVADYFCSSNLSTALVSIVSGKQEFGQITNLDTLGFSEKLLGYLVNILDEFDSDVESNLNLKQELKLLALFSTINAVDPKRFAERFKQVILKSKRKNLEKCLKFFFTQLGIVDALPPAAIYVFLENAKFLPCSDKISISRKFLENWDHVQCALGNCSIERFQILFERLFCVESVLMAQSYGERFISGCSNTSAEAIMGWYFRYPFSCHNVVKSFCPNIMDKATFEEPIVQKFSTENQSFVCDEMLVWMLTCSINEDFGDKFHSILSNNRSFESKQFVIPYLAKCMTAEQLLQTVLSELSIEKGAKISWAFNLFCAAFLKSVDNYSVSVDEFIAKKFVSYVFESSEFGTENEELFHVNLIFSKLWLSEGLAAFVMIKVFKTGVSNLTDRQLALLLHVLFQFPKLSSKMEVSEIAVRYSGSLHLRDQLLKQLILLWQNEGIELNLEKLPYQKDKALITIEGWNKLCIYSNQGPISAELVKVFTTEDYYDPEVLLTLINEDLGEESTTQQAVGLNIEKFVFSGKLSFLVMCLSENSPQAYATIAKLLLLKVSEKIRKWKHCYKDVIACCLTTLKNGLKSKDDTLPYLATYMYAQVFKHIFSEKLGFVPQIKITREAVSLQKRRKKAKLSQMKNREVESENKSASSLLKSLILGSEIEAIDSSTFPPRSFVELIFGSSEKAESELSEFLIEFFSKSCIGQASYAMMVKSGSLTRFIEMTGSKISISKNSVTAFANLVQGVANSRAVMKNAIHDFQIDFVLSFVQEVNCESDSIQKAAVDFVEAIVFDEKQRMYPIEDLLTSSRCSMLLKSYITGLDFLKKATNNILSDRNCAVIIILMVQIEDFCFHDTMQNYVNTFFERCCNNGDSQRSSKLLFYVKWTLDLCTTSAKDSVPDEHKKFFVQKIKLLLRKLKY